MDRRSRELRKHGLRIKLHEQPFRVLELLLERPGELITRDELQRQIWPADTFVDFEPALNTAINRLRQALGDSANRPRFIETLPRRGYRFVFPVERPASSEPKPMPPAIDGGHRGSWLWAALLIIAASCAAGAAYLTVLHTRAAGAETQIHSVAVLPLVNLSGDPGQDYFVDGMTDALITNLAQIASLRVISRSSVMQYKTTRKPLPEIGRELQVDAVVEGAVIRAGGRVRIDARLIQAATEHHLWSTSYERNVNAVTSLQSDIARAIASEIRVTIAPQAQARLLRSASIDPETYELYMKGRYFWAKRTDAANRKSIEYFEAAVQKRPDFGVAYAAMAEAYVTQRDLSPQEAFPRAERAARAALQIDDTLAEAHNALAASLFWYEWDWAGARKEFERALALNPNYALAHQWYGQYQKAMEWKDWPAEVKRAGELDPLSLVNAGAGWLIDSGQYDQAIDLLRKKLELDPDAPYANLLVGRAYATKGACAEALEYLQKSVALSGAAPEYVGHLGYANGLCGKRAEALKMLHQLQRLSALRYVSPYDLAVVYAGLGDKDLAFAALDAAASGHAREIVLMNHWPEITSLRADPRYARLKRRIGLPD